MSAPVSRRDDSAAGLLHPGDGHEGVQSVGRKGASPGSIRAESSSMVADSSSDARQVHAAQERVVLTKVAGQGLTRAGILVRIRPRAISA